MIRKIGSILSLLLLTAIVSTFVLGQANASGFAISDDKSTITLNGETIKEVDTGKIVEKYKQVLSIGLGIFAITAFLIMLFQFSKLGAAGDNPILRKNALIGILVSGIATALLGGLDIVVLIFWNVLNN